ncbi:MAG: DMT family transporter [Clostridia bacterium]|nr:DMT family transporter [Clostridia bacterium]
MFLTYLFAVLRSFIYGTTVYFTGDLIRSVDVLDVLALRFFMSFVVLWLLKVMRIVKIEVGVRDVMTVDRRSKYLRSLLLAALFEPVLYMVFETVGISTTTGITAGVILSLAPISSVICESLVLKEKTTGWQKLFLLIRVFGVGYIAVNTQSADGKDTALGIVLLILTVVSGSLFSVFSRHSSKAFSAMERTYVTATLGMVVFNSINAVRHLVEGDIVHYFDPYFNWSNMLGFFVLGIVSTIVATAMNNYSLARAPASTLSVFGGVSTLTTVTIGVCTGEQLMLYHIIGLVMIVVGMVGVGYIQIKRDKPLKK